MKKIILLVASTFLFMGLSGCTDYCEKALDKAKACQEKEKKAVNKADPPRFLQICKMNTAKFKKCLKIKNCKKYRECISKAGSDPAAIKALKNAPKSGDENAAPATDSAPPKSDMKTDMVSPKSDMKTDMVPPKTDMK